MHVKRLQSGQIVRLATVLGMGGEARIYSIAESPDLVAKVYHHPTPARIRKLQCMILDPPEDPMAGTGHIMIAWPLDLVTAEEDSSQILGFVMPRVSGMNPINSYYNPKWRRQHCPLFDWRYLHRLACNLTIAFRALHRRGYVIADVNERNILGGDNALVSVVDTDSFQVPDRAGGTILRCPVGTTEFTPRELQGVRFDDVDRNPQHDCFGLGVLIFRLLMEGTHPFEGLFLGSGEPAPYEERIARGHFPYLGEHGIPYRPKPAAPPLDILSPEIRALVWQCFVDGHDDPARRPTAEQWHSALERAMNDLASCDRNPQHFFSGHLDQCPWCQRTRTLGGRDPFPDPQTVRNMPVEAVRAPEETPVPIVPRAAKPPPPPTALQKTFRFLYRSRWVHAALTVALLLGLHQMSTRKNRQGSSADARDPNTTAPVARVVDVAGQVEMETQKDAWIATLAATDKPRLVAYAPEEYGAATAQVEQAAGKAVNAPRQAAALYRNARASLASATFTAHARYVAARRAWMFQHALAAGNRFAADGILAEIQHLIPAGAPYLATLRPAAPPLPATTTSAADPPLRIDLGKGLVMEFIPIRPGTFRMGSDTGDENERPSHEVAITRPYYLAKIEVTQEQWQAITGNNPSESQSPTQPVERVSWDDCQEFLAKLQHKAPGFEAALPTEAQWEFACRAGTPLRFSFGNNIKELGQYAWYQGNAIRPQAPARKLANPWGFHDMHGNVWEWCEDYESPYTAGRSIDPTGPAEGTARIVRGGAWCEEPEFCRSAIRRGVNPSSRLNSLGLRVCLRF